MGQLLQLLNEGRKAGAGIGATVVVLVQSVNIFLGMSWKISSSSSCPTREQSLVLPVAVDGEGLVQITLFVDGDNSSAVTVDNSSGRS